MQHYQLLITNNNDYHWQHLNVYDHEFGAGYNQAFHTIYTQNVQLQPIWSTTTPHASSHPPVPHFMHTSLLTNIPAYKHDDMMRTGMSHQSAHSHCMITSSFSIAASGLHACMQCSSSRVTASFKHNSCMGVRPFYANETNTSTKSSNTHHYQWLQQVTPTHIRM